DACGLTPARRAGGARGARGGGTSAPVGASLASGSTGSGAMVIGIATSEADAGPVVGLADDLGDVEELGAQALLVLGLACAVFDQSGDGGVVEGAQIVAADLAGDEGSVAASVRVGPAHVRGKIGPDA